MSDVLRVVGSSHRASGDHSESLRDGLPVGVGSVFSSLSLSREVVHSQTSGGYQTVGSVGPFIVKISCPVVAVVDLYSINIFRCRSLQLTSFREQVLQGEDLVTAYSVMAVRSL